MFCEKVESVADLNEEEDIGLGWDPVVDLKTVRNALRTNDQNPELERAARHRTQKVESVADLNEEEDIGLGWDPVVDLKTVRNALRTNDQNPELERAARHRTQKVESVADLNVEEDIGLGWDPVVDLKTVRNALRTNDQNPELERAARHRTQKVESVADLNEQEDIGLGWDPVVDLKTVRNALRTNDQNPELERAARHRTLRVDLDAVEDLYAAEQGPTAACAIARHYGVFRDLLPGAYFTPVTRLIVEYDQGQDKVIPVCTGNMIAPAQASAAPSVLFDADGEGLWTLLMTNPDGHLTDNHSEVLHWLVGNIKGSDLSTGEVLCDYLRPFPPRGTGYHRHVFLLFKQESQIDYSQEQRPSHCTSLRERTFKTAEFFKTYCDLLTPVGLSFFQSDWDESVRETYHNTLQMREPSFEYAHTPHYIAVQRKYPKNEPFDRYFDRYRDQKDVQEEVLRIKMDEISPFTAYSCPKFPLTHVIKHRDKTRPSWLARRLELRERRQDQWRDMPE